MVKPRRNQTKVLEEFLNNCTVKANITHLEQKVNLSYYNAIEIAQRLMSIGYVTMAKTQKKKSRFYSHTVIITESGRTALTNLTETNIILQAMHDVIII